MGIEPTSQTDESTNSNTARRPEKITRSRFLTPNPPTAETRRAANEVYAAWMRHPSFTCSVCNAPREVREIIEAELQKEKSVRRPLRVLAALSGLSKSAISRHSCKCLALRKLANFRDKRKGGPRPKRIVVKWPDGRFTSHDPWNERDAGPVSLQGPILPSDLYLQIVDDDLPAEVIARSKQIQAQRELRAVASRQTCDIENEGGQSETEQALKCRDKAI
jgi:hypothetical protein